TRTGSEPGAVRRLELQGYMPQDRARALADAYRLLRNVEHKLQVAAGRQTHALPTGEEALGALAARMGFGKSPEALARLTSELSQVRNLVASQFRETLASGVEDNP